MALVQATVPVSATYSFRDNNGNVATTAAFFSPTLTLPALLGRAIDYGAVLEPISNASLISAAVTILLTEDSIVAATPESEVERKLVITGRTSNPRSSVKFFIPSPIFSLDQANTDVPLPTSPELIALIGFLTSGGVLPGNGPVNNAGLDVLGITDAIVRHYNRQRKG